LVCDTNNAALARREPGIHNHNCLGLAPSLAAEIMLGTARMMPLAEAATA